MSSGVRQINLRVTQRTPSPGAAFSPSGRVTWQDRSREKFAQLLAEGLASAQLRLRMVLERSSHGFWLRAWQASVLPAVVPSAFSFWPLPLPASVTVAVFPPRSPSRECHHGCISGSSDLCRLLSPSFRPHPNARFHLNFSPESRHPPLFPTRGN